MAPPTLPGRQWELGHGGQGDTNRGSPSLLPPTPGLGTVGDDDADGVGLGEGSHGDVELLGDAVGGVNVETALQGERGGEGRGGEWGEKRGRMWGEEGENGGKMGEEEGENRGRRGGEREGKRRTRPGARRDPVRGIHPLTPAGLWAAPAGPPQSAQGLPSSLTA